MLGGRGAWGRGARGRSSAWLRACELIFSRRADSLLKNDAHYLPACACLPTQCQLGSQTLIFVRAQGHSCKVSTAIKTPDPSAACRNKKVCMRGGGRGPAESAGRAGCDPSGAERHSCRAGCLGGGWTHPLQGRKDNRPGQGGSAGDRWRAERSGLVEGAGGRHHRA